MGRSKEERMYIKDDLIEQINDLPGLVVDRKQIETILVLNEICEDCGGTYHSCTCICEPKEVVNELQLGRIHKV